MPATANQNHQNGWHWLQKQQNLHDSQRNETLEERPVVRFGGRVPRSEAGAVHAAGGADASDHVLVFSGYWNNADYIRRDKHT